MGTALLWYVGVTLALAALFATVIGVQGIAEYSRRRSARSISRGNQRQGQAGARRGRDAA